MKLLLDTHVLLWAAIGVERLPADAQVLMGDMDNELYFSAASLWEIVVKQGLGREDFIVDAHALRRSLLDNGYGDLPMLSQHALAAGTLPPLHKDPFDRMLVAQATVEGITLLTADAQVAAYPGPVRRVGSGPGGL